MEAIYHQTPVSDHRLPWGPPLYLYQSPQDISLPLIAHLNTAELLTIVYQLKLQLVRMSLLGSCVKQLHPTGGPDKSLVLQLIS